MDKLRLVKGWPLRTIQGEGVLVGTPSTFLRLAGCDLRCHREGAKYWQCDTPESLPDYDWKRKQWAPLTSKAYEATPEETRDAVTQLGFCHLVVTGGEPTLQADSLALTLGLIHNEDEHQGRHRMVTLETNGRHFDPVLAEFIDMPSLSPKIQFWDETTRRTIGEWLIHCGAFGKPAQLKIVCVDATDYDVATSIFLWAKDLAEVECLIQPAYDNSDMTALARLVSADNIARMIPQIHKVINMP